MSDRLCRMQMMIALPYGVAGLFYLSGSACEEIKLIRDSLQFACVVGTVFASLTVLGIWRRYVRWSGLRVSSTAALTILTIAQVVIWQPIWSSTQCAVEEFQRFAQSSLGLGIWIGSCAFVWWAGYLLKPRPKRDVNSNWSHTMNTDCVRLSIAWSLAFLLPGLYFLEWAGLEIFTSLVDETKAFICYASCTVLAIGTWLLLWHKRVIWETRRTVLTVVLLLIFLLSSASVLLPTGVVSLQFTSTMIYTTLKWTSPLLAAGLWFAGTAWLWRSDRIEMPAGLDSESDMSAFVRCGSCGYSLVGLREVRCPECGWQSTVDEAVRRGMAEYNELRGAAVT